MCVLQRQKIVAGVFRCVVTQQTDRNEERDGFIDQSNDTRRQSRFLKATGGSDEI